jgi:hypothetical protein
MRDNQSTQNSIVSYKDGLAGEKSANLPFKLFSQDGSALVMIIISIVVIASIGTAMLTSTNTSTYTQIGSVDTLNGYFLAEAGKYYALDYIKDEIANSRNPENDRSCDILNSDNCTAATPKTFTLYNNSGQFKLKLTVAPSGCDNSIIPCTYTLVSTGIPNSRTNRELTYIIAKE